MVSKVVLYTLNIEAQTHFFFWFLWWLNTHLFVFFTNCGWQIYWKVQNAAYCMTADVK